MEKIKLAATQAEKDKKDLELKDKFNCPDVSIDLEKCDDTIDKIEGQKAKPIELKEKDPILDHVSHEQPDQVDLLTEKDEPITSKGSSKISETKHETSDGKLRCTWYGLKKAQKTGKETKVPRQQL